MKSFEQVKDSLINAFADVLPEGKLKQIMLLRDEALLKAPRIVIIGKTGVGKTSTLNALFNCELPISHTEACTYTAKPIVITNKKGHPIVIIDMPGFDEGEEEDEAHKLLYAKILPECDLVLWILDITDRSMKFQQIMLKEVLNLHVKKLVIAANKADIIHPNNWIEEHCIPSQEQEGYLEKRIINIRSKLCSIYSDLNEDQIIYYSSVKKYRLEALFRAMLEACSDSEAWVLAQRTDREHWSLKTETNIEKIFSNLIGDERKR